MTDKGGIDIEAIRQIVLAVRRDKDATPGIVRAFFDSEAATLRAFEAVKQASCDANALHEFAGHLWDESGSELLACEVLRMAVQQGADDALVALGEALSWLGNYEEALQVLQTARESGVGDPVRVAGLLGDARYELGERDEEVERLLAKGASEYLEFGVHYAQMLRRRGEFDSAVDLLRNLVDAQQYGAALLLGNILADDIGEIEEAIGAYLRGIESGDAHSALNLSVVYWELGDEIQTSYFRRVARELGDMTEWADEGNCDEMIQE